LETLDVRASRPDLPASYGLEAPWTGAALARWGGAWSRFRRARNYWVATMMIVEGVVDEVRDPGCRARIDTAYLAKYGVRLGDVPGDVVLYGVRLAVAFGWRERDFPKSATRWTLDWSSAHRRSVPARRRPTGTVSTAARTGTVRRAAPPERRSRGRRGAS
jgi:hypothetical protein